jgi:hypothetical protein
MQFLFVCTITHTRSVICVHRLNATLVLYTALLTHTAVVACSYRVRISSSMQHTDCSKTLVFTDEADMHTTAVALPNVSLYS